LPPGRDSTFGGEGRTGTFDELTEGHTRWARRLAPTTLHAGTHEAHERVVDRLMLDLDLAHRGDSTSR
jgi:hypothetical protein